MRIHRTNPQNHASVRDARDSLSAAMPVLYFVRHGESEANRLLVFSNRDLPHALTDVGRAQVEDLALRLLQDVPFAAIYASPIQRARESAEILADRLGAPFELIPALAEFDMGVLEGTSAGEGWQRQKALFEAWRAGDTHACIEGGESFEDIRGRFVPFIDSLRTHPRQAHILLVGHGGTFVCMLPELLTNVTPRFAMHHPLAHCDVVVAHLDDSSLSCRRWGNHHFD